MRSTEDAVDLLGSMGAGPFVIKRLRGQATFDQFVITETQADALLAIDQLRKQNRDFLVQQYVAEAKRSDVRVIVVGGSAITAILRTAKGTSFLPLSEFSQVSVELSIEERQLAEAAAKSLELEIADVTLLRSNLGPLVLDVNPFPQLEWWDISASKTVANQMIELIELSATKQ